MNPHSPSFDPAAEDQAALWAARLDGSVLSGDDRTALQAWLAQNPAHRNVLAKYCDFSSELNEALPAFVQAGFVTMPATERPPRRSRGFLLAAASALAGAAAVVAFLWVAAPAHQSDRIATAVAQRQSITLVDGTRVDLNARTTLQVDIGRSERHVRLTGGEAFFAVTKDKARPFTVETAAGDVRVTGTQFDVRTGTAGAMEVTVFEGSVQVSPNQASTPTLLGPGQRLTTGAGGFTVQTLSPGAMADATAWRQGQIVFDGVPLQDALAQFSQYHDRSIVAAPDAAGLRLSARFSLDDLDGFCAALERTLPVEVEREPAGAIRVSRRPVR